MVAMKLPVVFLFCDVAWTKNMSFTLTIWNQTWEDFESPNINHIYGENTQATCYTANRKTKALATYD